MRPKHRLTSLVQLTAVSLIATFACDASVGLAATSKVFGREFYEDSKGDICLGAGPPFPPSSCRWANHVEGVAHDNVALGSNMMPNLTEGFNNIALNEGALEEDNLGVDNIAIGYNTLHLVKEGSANVALGSLALRNAQSTGNTATGSTALYSDTGGEGNVADGSLGLFGNTTGEYNLALGTFAGFNNTSGSNNIDISNEGTSTDNATTRIGTDGTQTRAFMAGIYGVALTGSVCAVEINTEGQLGCGPVSATASSGTSGVSGAFAPARAAEGAASAGLAAPSASSVVGGGIGGAVAANGFTMSLYAQTTATPMIQAGALSNFAAHFRADVSTNTVLTVQKNGADTSVGCTVPAGTNGCADTTHTADFAASDTILVRATYSGSNSGTNPSWSASYP
jgi:hypothetical protein